MKEKCSIDEFSDNQLREELEFRGYSVFDEGELENRVEEIVCGDSEEEEEGYFLKKDFSDMN